MWIYKILFMGLFLTLLFELTVAFLWKVRKADIKIVILANVVTNPLVVLLYYLALSASVKSWGLIAILEISAVIFESVCYKFKSNIKSPIIFAIVANVVSYSLGLLIF